MPSPARQEHLAHASYHQVFLAPLEAAPVYDGQDAGAVVSLVPVAHDDVALIVTTGCADGPVHITIETGSAPLPVDDAWEVQEAVSLIIGKPLYISSPTWARVFDPVMSPTTPGPHRVRVSARGRTLDYDASATRSDEYYLIQAWPEPQLRPREAIRDNHLNRI
jgi:hypothetical protein